MYLALGGGVDLRWGRLVCNLSSLSLARHVHGVVGHVHWSSHGGIVLSCGL